MIDNNAQPPFLSFERRQVKNEYASEQKGHAVFETVDYVTSQQRGSQESYHNTVKGWLEVCRQQVKLGQLPQTWYDMFNAAYEAWKKNEELPESGTPLEQWPMASKTEVEHLKQWKVRTIEQLAALNEEALKNIGCFNLRTEAQKYLAQVNSKSVDKERIADLEKKLAEQSELVKGLLDRLEKAEAAKVVKERKPRKSAAVPQEAQTSPVGE